MRDRKARQRIDVLETRVNLLETRVDLMSQACEAQGKLIERLAENLKEAWSMHESHADRFLELARIMEKFGEVLTPTSADTPRENAR